MHPYLVTLTAEGKINYAEFLDRYKIEFGEYGPSLDQLISPSESFKMYKKIKKEYLETLQIKSVSNLQQAFEVCDIVERSQRR